MLEFIRIRNYAIIDDLELEFGEGFNVFTGESGVGKSIIVDALGFCLGDRANPSIIKTGRDRVVVEAVFRINNERIKEKITSLDFVLEDDRIIIKREFDSSGRSRITINSNTETVSRLSELSDFLVDFHGQHEHQSLLNQKTHIDYLDAFGGFYNELIELKNIYERALNLRREIKDLQNKISQNKDKLDFLRYTVDELRGADLKEGEDIELEDRFKYVSNYEQVLEIIKEVVSFLEDSEYSSISTISKAIGKLKFGVRINPSFEDLVKNLEDGLSQIRSVSNELNRLISKINITPDEVEYINRRLDLIRTLKRKYNKNSVSELIEYMRQCEKAINDLELGDENLVKLQDEYSRVLGDLKNACIELSTKRIRKAKELDQKVEGLLRLLGMEKAVFRTDFKYYKSDDGMIEINGTRVDVNEKGIDRVEFMISTNPGLEVRPLRSVASGGEISRIMLAIKSVLANVSEVDMMVFDEIDVGIGGNTANIVGDLIKDISKKQQIIVITHLPQVASRSDVHFKVEKIFESNTTKVIVKKLSSFEERKREIARMFGNETETGLKHAEELLTKSLR
ncbi:MAG: DNA repair protein RecN [Brevinematales bacterium]|nr:DNA repair protein RecN [Brevinematales bacterium]